MGFVFGWILPGVLLFWLAASYPLTAFWIALAYYSLSVFLLVKFIVVKMQYRLREGGFPMRKLSEVLGLMNAAYEQLSEELIHVPSLQKSIAAARDKGAVWPSQVYVILDSVAAKSPSGWDRAAGWSGR